MQHKDETNEKREATELAWQQLQGRLPQPDVLMSSFANWDEVGRWYGGLQEERVKPTPEVTAKAVELTKNAANDDAKLRALYAYVSTQFHYVGVAFGIGRYQPHSAGKCSPTSMAIARTNIPCSLPCLTAVGIPAYPALISTSREIDADVPSPGQYEPPHHGRAHGRRYGVARFHR